MVSLWVFQKKAGRRARMDPRAGALHGERLLTSVLEGPLRGLTDSPSSANIGPSDVGRIGQATTSTGMQSQIVTERARMDLQAPGVEGVTLMTSRTFRGLTDSPSSAHIGPSGVGQPVVGTAVAATGDAWGTRFDPNTGRPIPKFDPMTGKQNWGGDAGVADEVK